MTRLLNKDEVAELLGVSVRTVERLRGRGLLPWIKLLGAIRFRPDDVRTLVDAPAAARSTRLLDDPRRRSHGGVRNSGPDAL